ncbi:MAG: Eco57I restriction-modification methylase domain-containing protein [Bacteroidales bacterium]|nr:Eco57I restriction-modification methylase domain-containing protein [Bacteroidales bacterium]
MNTSPFLQALINNYNDDKLEYFLREKSDILEFTSEELSFDKEKFINYDNAKLLAKSDLPDGSFVVCTLHVIKNLTERSSKKDQYELAKNILKNSSYDAGIFVFYDNNNNFRFSLIYAEYQDNKRTWNNFKRFTYFVSPHQTNKTFKEQIGNADFSSIESLKKAFSVEPVTKQFYNEIQNWYFWAMDKINFPTDYKYSDDPDKDKEIRNSHNLIRLITRIIFIWFLKQKNLINDDLFSEEKLKNIIKDFYKNKDSANYYNAILQNLFFATLNQTMNERKFAEDNGFPANKKEYGIKNLYRYKDKFLISENDVLKLFKDIPFLNGGLFDCLDKNNDDGKVINIDGFTRIPQKQAIIPDYLFFQNDETKVNLSKYGLPKDSPVKGLIKILQGYNFTIDENTLIDQEIALDPELLGKVFENLLASYNHETSITARKATGSFYTPREIVDYMVQESLFNYLIDKCPTIDQTKLNDLLSYSENSIDLTDTERYNIIDALGNIKILDPACGSGAFPMGALHKIVYALQKLDPYNEYWRELQRQKASQESQEVFKQNNKYEREERLKEINETFDESINYPDYARKLYLIENCIYGVDIQPIAIQISKLRFFISLVIDQKVDETRDNLGIRALPNLETRFVSANTLLGLEIPKNGSISLDSIYQNYEFIELQKKLNEIRHKYFSAKTRYEKLKYKDYDKNYRKKLADLVKDFLTKINKNEISEIQNKIEELNLILQDVIKEPKNIKVIEVKTIFGDKEKIKIDKNKIKINKIRNEIKNYEDRLKILQKQIESEYIITISEKIANFDLYDPNATTDWFDPEWMFGIKDGFDIVIANPPYVRQERIRDQKQALQKQGYEVYNSTSDLYTYFYERSYHFLKPNGFACFISSNKWMRAKYGEKLRKFFKEKTTIKQIIDFNGYQVFDATVDSNILLFQKKEPSGNIIHILNINPDFTPETDIAEYFNSHKLEMKQSEIDTNCFTFGDETVMNLKNKIEEKGIPLKDWNVKIYRGVLTGLNEAFIIDETKRQEILDNCKDDDERRRTEAIIKPILRGRDIKRYYYKWAGLWVIVIPEGWTNANRNLENAEIFINDHFPSLMNHLKQFETKAKKRDDKGDYWWELRACSYYREFEKEKVVWTGVGTQLETAVIPRGVYLNAPANFMTGKQIKYLQAVLNSNLITWHYDLIKTKIGSKG